MCRRSDWGLVWTGARMCGWSVDGEDGQSKEKAVGTGQSVSRVDTVGSWRFGGLAASSLGQEQPSLQHSGKHLSTEQSSGLLQGRSGGESRDTGH